MSQKSVPDPTLSPPLTWRMTESQEDVSWSEALTPIVLDLGVVVLLVSAIFVPVAAIGYGDCVTRTLCDEQDFWAGVFRSQAASGTNHRVAVGMAGATINPPGGWWRSATRWSTKRGNR